MLAAIAKAPICKYRAFCMRPGAGRTSHRINIVIRNALVMFNEKKNQLLQLTCGFEHTISLCFWQKLIRVYRYCGWTKCVYNRVIAVSNAKWKMQCTKCVCVCIYELGPYPTHGPLPKCQPFHGFNVKIFPFLWFHAAAQSIQVIHRDKLICSKLIRLGWDKVTVIQLFLCEIE